MSGGAAQEETETAKQLRLGPSVHRRVIPTDFELASSERPVGLLPALQRIAHDSNQRPIERLEPAGEQRCEVDTFGVVVQLTAVHRHARAACERVRQARFVEQIVDVIIDAPFDGRRAARHPSRPLDLGQAFEDKAGVKVIDEISYAVDGVVPRSVGVLRFEDESSVAPRRVQVFLVVQVTSSEREQTRAISAGIDDATVIARARSVGT